MDYFGLLLLQVKLIDTVEGVIYLSSTVLSLLLLALSISAYKNTDIKKIAYAIAAFALFATFLFYEYLETVFEFLGETYSDLLLPSMTFGVLVLFFLAIVKKS